MTFSFSCLFSWCRGDIMTRSSGPLFPPSFDLVPPFFISFPLRKWSRSPLNFIVCFHESMPLNFIVSFHEGMKMSWYSIQDNLPPFCAFASFHVILYQLQSGIGHLVFLLVLMKASWCHDTRFWTLIPTPLWLGYISNYTFSTVKWSRLPLNCIASLQNGFVVFTAILPCLMPVTNKRKSKYMLLKASSCWQLRHQRRTTLSGWGWAMETPSGNSGWTNISRPNQRPHVPLYRT